jgi:hypothetical protein
MKPAGKGYKLADSGGLGRGEDARRIAIDGALDRVRQIAPNPAVLAL